MRQNCSGELDKLLKQLNIPRPDWAHGDEFEISQKLDNEIEKKICELLKSDSDLAGYAKLLDMGGVKFSISETRKERLGKILANRNKILSGASAQSNDNASASESGFWSSLINWIKSIFSGKKNFAPPPSDKLSRAQIEKAFPVLEQISKIFDSI